MQIAIHLGHLAQLPRALVTVAVVRVADTTRRHLEPRRRGHDLLGARCPPWADGSVLARRSRAGASLGRTWAGAAFGGTWTCASLVGPAWAGATFVYWTGAGGSFGRRSRCG